MLPTKTVEVGGCDGVAEAAAAAVDIDFTGRARGGSGAARLPGSSRNGKLLRARRLLPFLLLAVIRMLFLLLRMFLNDAIVRIVGSDTRRRRSKLRTSHGDAQRRIAALIGVPCH